MAATKDFFETGTLKQFEWVLNLYDQALRLKAENKSSKPENIIKIDKWYQNDLPKKIKSRGKDAHLVHEEMVQTMKWKLARGKYRPNLVNLVMMNTPRVCMVETKKAFRKLSKDDMVGAVQALCNMKGVGPQMASAVLAAGAPNVSPFMADECLLAMPDVESLDTPTIKEYMSYVEHTKACAARINLNGASDWTPHRVELAVWTYYILHDLKPELLQDLPSANDSILASDRVNNQTTEGANNDTDDTKITHPSAKSTEDDSTDSSLSAASIPQENSETHIEAGNSTGIPPANGESANELSNNHNVAADNGGTDPSSNARENDDAKAEEKLEGGCNGGKQTEIDLNSEKVVAKQNTTPIMTNGKDKNVDTSALSPSQKNHDAQSSPASLTLQTTNGTHGSDAKPNKTSKNRLQPGESSINEASANGNSKNGSLEVRLNEEKSTVAVTSNNVGEDWVMVEKEDCPAMEPTEKIPPASTKRLHENAEQEKDTLAGSDDASPLEKKLRKDEPTCDQDTINAIKKAQQEPRADTGASPTKVDNGSSLVV